MLKKFIKSLFVLSLATVLIFSQAATALASDTKYYSDSLYISSGSTVMLKGTKTTDGSFSMKGLESPTFAIQFDTAKTPSASFSLSIKVVSRSGETKSLYKNYYGVNDYAFITVPGFYEGGWYTVTINAYKDLYIKSYSSL